MNHEGSDVPVNWRDVVASISSYESAQGISRSLRHLWEHVEEIPRVLYSRHFSSDVIVPDLPTARAAPPEVLPWDFGLSVEFRKNVDKIDRKLQGRILDAIRDLTDDPLTVRGDTVKPLSGHMKGLWRFRIGDYRLVYLPDPARRRIALVSFAARGSIYDD